MELPFTFPDWVPWWVQTLCVVVAVLFALALLLMPFATFGVKSRLEGIEVRLDELQADLRVLALRLPERGGSRDLAQDWTDVAPETLPSRDRIPDRPPVPPVARTRDDGNEAPRRVAERRTEPRFDRQE